MTPTENMTLEELRTEYSELGDKIFKKTTTVSDEDHERRGDIWTELKSRTGVEQPECPSCGVRNWGFTDHTVCRSCGIGPVDEELLSEIQDAWDEIAGRG